MSICDIRPLARKVVSNFGRATDGQQEREYIATYQIIVTEPTDSAQTILQWIQQEERLPWFYPMTRLSSSTYSGRSYYR